MSFPRLETDDVQLAVTSDDVDHHRATEAARPTVSVPGMPAVGALAWPPPPASGTALTGRAGRRSRRGSCGRRGRRRGGSSCSAATPLDGNALTGVAESGCDTPDYLAQGPAPARPPAAPALRRRFNPCGRCGNRAAAAGRCCRRRVTEAPRPDGVAGVVLSTICKVFEPLATSEAGTKSVTPLAVTPCDSDAAGWLGEP